VQIWELTSFPNGQYLQERSVPGGRVRPLLIALVFRPQSVWPQEPPKSNPQRDHAFELYEQGSMVEALPLLEE
jgi:hypothetical protein